MKEAMKEFTWEIYQEPLKVKYINIGIDVQNCLSSIRDY